MVSTALPPIDSTCASDCSPQLTHPFCGLDEAKGIANGACTGGVGHAMGVDASCCLLAPTFSSSPSPTDRKRGRVLESVEVATNPKKLGPRTGWTLRMGRRGSVHACCHGAANGAYTRCCHKAKTIWIPKSRSVMEK